MNPNTKCNVTPLKKSQEMIRAILNDITQNYTHVGGGGITEIKQTATDTFVVSIAQEERIDQIAYELELGEGCEVKILKQDISAISL